MAKRVQVNGKKVIETEGGVIWSRNSGLGHYERGNYEAELFGVRYELERRKWYPGDTPITGWYLYSFNVSGGFFGEWCDTHLLDAADKATELILKRDLRKE